MKNFIFIILIACFFTACKNDNNSVNPSTEGVWKVSSYIDSGKNETTDFNGYTFEFKSNGQFLATYTGILLLVYGVKM